MLTMQDHQLVALRANKTIPICEITERDQVNAIVMYYGCTSALAFTVITDNLRLGKLLAPKGL